MIHPVKECIQKLGLTHRAFVVLYDISWERFRSCLYGYTASIPCAILNVMVQHGFDEQEAQRQYLLWRKWSVQQKLAAPATTEGRVNP
ncbi:preprotein translocase subunit TatA [Brevibacillus ruminantium]|uniref:Preprotein translocase subunit TatA n=1 Tax=Brevibacillus ruminantium TaxID=2950604 RepID=A0ABY4WJZ8_9BACL|nr:preprotein translocase subunit TatA [Brevibacillus ruminantium]USG64976.1 preprotein translocase subunit TatA [Brevibacillus ruminantium]